MNAPAVPQALPEPGARVADKYVIDELIGRGGMGAVYAVTHALTKKPFALKWMIPQLAGDQEAMSRFVREAQATCAIDHPNVVQVFDVGTSGDAMFLVMELLQGENLGERMKRGRMAPQELIELLGPVMHGLAQAHEAGIVHRDLKPDNIFLCVARPGQPALAKVLDFGISKVGGPADMSLTATNTAMGTPYYMAPEQLRDASNVDARADVYALGAVMYEALAGAQPIDADSFAHLVIKVATEDPAPIATIRPDLAPAFAAVIDRCLAKDPAARPQSMRALLAEVGAALGWDLQRWEETGVGSRMRFISNAPPPMAGPASGSAPSPPAEPFAMTPHAGMPAHASAAGATLEDAPVLPTSSRRGALLVALVLLLVVAVAGALAFGGGKEGAGEGPGTPSPVAQPAATPVPAAPAADAPVGGAPSEAPAEAATPVAVSPPSDVAEPSMRARARHRARPTEPAPNVAPTTTPPPVMAAPAMTASPPTMAAGTRVDWDAL